MLTEHLRPSHCSCVCDGVFVLTGSQSLDRLRTRNLYLKPNLPKANKPSLALGTHAIFRSLVRTRDY